MPKSDWVSWLNMTNIALGTVVFLAVLLVASAMAWEIAGRYKRKARNIANLDEELNAMLHDERLVPGLGVTMADGGERIKPLPRPPVERKRS